MNIYIAIVSLSIIVFVPLMVDYIISLKQLKYYENELKKMEDYINKVNFKT